MIFSPSSTQARTDPGPTPSLRRTSAGTEICPCAVSFDCASAIKVHYHGKGCVATGPPFSPPSLLDGKTLRISCEAPRCPGLSDFIPKQLRQPNAPLWRRILAAIPFLIEAMRDEPVVQLRASHPATLRVIGMNVSLLVSPCFAGGSVTASSAEHWA